MSKHLVSHSSSGNFISSRSSSLLYYYSFLNLAKAGIVIRNPKLLRKRLVHGLNYKVESKRNFEFETVSVTYGRKDVFAELYKQYFGVNTNIKAFNINTLLGYCSDISSQYKKGNFGERKIFPTVYVNLVSDIDKNNKVGWSLIGIQDFDSVKMI